MKIERPLVVLDLETTGTWVERDKIVEIGMVKLATDLTRTTYVKRVNPGILIPKAVSQMIGITDADVKDAPRFADIAQEVFNFVSDTDLAGFSIERFDLPVLEREMIEAGMAFEWRSRNIYDAQKIYHLNEKRDLTAAYKFYCGKTLHNAHTALGDAEATLEILVSQKNKYASESPGIEALGNFEYKRPGEHFDRDGKFCWWNGKLYPMFGKYARRRSLNDIAKKDRGYLNWILSSDFNDDVKNLVADAIEGKFPKAPTD